MWEGVHAHRLMSIRIPIEKCMIKWCALDFGMKSECKCIQMGMTSIAPCSGIQAVHCFIIYGDGNPDGLIVIVHLYPGPGFSMLKFLHRSYKNVIAIIFVFATRT